MLGRLWGSRALGLAALLLAACGSGGQGIASGAKSQVAPPDFELSTVDGRSERLSEHLGKEVVLLDFWATFCEPCLAGMPHLDALYRQHKAEASWCSASTSTGLIRLPK